MIIKQCSYCNNNIRIHEIKFPVVNDYGGVIVECEACANLSYTEIINPEETAISKGAKKVDTWDNEIVTTEKALEKYPNIKELKSGLVVVGDFESREYEFDYRAPHIYLCESCGKEVESVSKSELLKNSTSISKAYDNLMNFILANHRYQRDSFVVEVNVECDCGQKFISYWHSKFVPNNKSINLNSEVFLIGTNMPLRSENIDGIMSKNDCKRILEKFVIRWNAIHSRLLIVTPFVGHQWLSQEEIIELWDWIKNFLNPEKSTLVTRTATFNKYKKACEEKGISIDILDNFGLNNLIIKDFTRKQDFHAKIYVGYSLDKSEIIMGSFNLMDGPSVENISFKSCTFKNFLDRFILPMKITIETPSTIEKYWSHIIQNKDGDWISNEIESQAILTEITKYK